MCGDFFLLALLIRVEEVACENEYTFLFHTLCNYSFSMSKIYTDCGNCFPCSDGCTRYSYCLVEECSVVQDKST